MSTMRESKSLTKFSNFLALTCSIINSVTSSDQGVASQQGWRDANRYDDVCDNVLGSEGELVLGGS